MFPLHIGIPQDVRHPVYGGERTLDGSFLVRIDQASGGRGQHAAGDQQLPIDPLGPEGLPDVFETPDQGGDFLLSKGLEARGHDSPDDDASPVEEFADGLNIGSKNFSVGVDIQGEHVKVQPEQEVPIRVAAEMNSPGPIHLREELVQISSGLDIAVSCHGGGQQVSGDCVGAI